MPMPNNQVVILEDAIATCDNFKATYKIANHTLRDSEQDELIERIRNDIQTVLRMAGYGE